MGPCIVFNQVGCVHVGNIIVYYARIHLSIVYLCYIGMRIKMLTVIYVPYIVTIKIALTTLWASMEK